MFDGNQVTEGTIARSAGDPPVTGGLDRSATGSSIIGTFMGANCIQDRMASTRIEIRADSKNIERVA